jgi:AraC-like DNA-binding protein
MLLYFAITVLFLSIILLIYNWNENKTAIYLGGFLFLVAWYAVTHYFTSIAKDPFWFAIFYGNFAFLNLAAGPLIYFYVRGTIQDTAQLHPKDALHFIPFSLNFVGLLPHILSPFSDKLVLAKNIIADFSTLPTYQIDQIVPIQVNFMMRQLLLLGYSTYSLYSLYQFKQRQTQPESSPQYRITFRWLFAFLFITVFSTTCYLYFTVGFFFNQPTDALIRLNWATYVMTFTLFAICIFLLIFPQILYGLPHFNTKSNEELEITLDSDLEERFINLGEQIKTYIAEEKPYLNPEFSLTDLAQKLDVPQHHISYCFRFIFKQGFPKMRSEYRITYAKKLLENPKNDYLSYEGIGLESGFSARSRFYAAFQEIEGCSPGEYREKIQSL